MIVAANTAELKSLAAQILAEHAHVKTTADFQALMWVDPETNEVQWCVGYDGFVGKICQMHIVKLGNISLPKQFLWAGFDYPFNQAGMEAVTGVVNSKNVQAMRFDKHLGFAEILRLPSLHDDGGDVVFLKMDKADCKWLKLGNKYEAQLLAA